MWEQSNNDLKIQVYNREGDNITFSSINPNDISNKKYKEVKISNKSLLFNSTIQSGLQIANQASTLANIIKSTPNGLYTATTNAGNLSKLADGTTSTIIRENGKIIEHAGFSEVGLSSTTLNPAAILSISMQAMSMISGTYYLHKINKELTTINDKLSNLQELHHDQNIGKILTIHSGLSDLINRTIVNDLDISTIRMYKKDADNIEKEYLFRLNRDSSKELKLDKNNEDFLKEFERTIHIANEAHISSLMCEIIEIGIRMKNGDSAEVVDDLINQFENHYNSNYLSNLKKQISKVFNDLNILLLDKNRVKKLRNARISKVSIGVANGLVVTTLGPIVGTGTMLATTAVTKINKEKKSQEKFSAPKLDTKLSKKKKGFEECNNSIQKYLNSNQSNITLDSMMLNIKQSKIEDKELILLPDGNSQRIFIEAK